MTRVWSSVSPTSRRGRLEPCVYSSGCSHSNLFKLLLPLAVATFVVGTDAFMIAGLLPDISTDLDVTVAAAGQLVTVFALTISVAAPVLGWLLSALDRRKALQSYCVRGAFP